VRARGAHRRHGLPRVIAALAIAGLGAPMIALGGDWPQLGHDAGHTGFNARERAISAANIANLTQYWHTSDTGGSFAPSVAHGVAYVHAGRLSAFDAGGSRGCAGRAGCSPLWASRGGRFEGGSSPAVANGVVYVEGSSLGAFDAGGRRGCAGRPQRCSPLWSSDLGNVVGGRSPAIANGVVYVEAETQDLVAHLYAFDAAGRRGCARRRKVCSPLWSAETAAGESERSSSPVVAKGLVFVVSSNGNDGSTPAHAYAFDAGGKRGCAGRPKICSPLWNADLGKVLVQSSPVVANGAVYVSASRPIGNPPSSFEGKVYGFDASGERSCAGEPRTCSPLWVADTGDTSDQTSVAAANGIVYVGAFKYSGLEPIPQTSTLDAFDATGQSGCSGEPKTCSPLWHAVVKGLLRSPPSIANGLLYVGTGGTEDEVQGGNLYAFDAAGRRGCSGKPKNCSPLWSASTGDRIDLSTPVLANGALYVSGVNCTEECGGVSGSDLYAYAIRYTARLQSTRRTVEAGAALSVKLELLNAAKANVSAATLGIRALCVARAARSDCKRAPIRYRSRFFAFRPNLGARGGYVFTVKTRGLRPGRYKLLFRAAGEPRSEFHQASFRLERSSRR
jgi:hypothetical protein